MIYIVSYSRKSVAKLNYSKMRQLMVYYSSNKICLKITERTLAIGKRLFLIHLRDSSESRYCTEMAIAVTDVDAKCKLKDVKGTKLWYYYVRIKKKK